MSIKSFKKFSLTESKDSTEHSIIDGILKDLRNQLEESRKQTQSFDDGELRWRDGMESGLETAIEIVEESLLNFDTKDKNSKNNYLVALPSFRGAKGFNHQTILVSAKDENDARVVASSLKPNRNIGDIKKVDY